MGDRMNGEIDGCREGGGFQGSKFAVATVALPCFVICYRDTQVVTTNICYCHKCMVLLIYSND